MVDFQAVFDQLDLYLTHRMRFSHTPGLQLALFNRAETVRVLSEGVSDLESSTPVQPETLFGIGSITKSFTAVAVLQAAERGWLELHRPVTAYLPWLEVPSQFAPITLHHLLAHTAGIVGVIDKSPDTRAAAWALRETQTAWPPGAHFYYSDAGYQLLGLVLEAVTGQSLATIFRSHIFEPLGMTASEPAFTQAIRPRMAKGYRALYDDRPPHLTQPLVPEIWLEMAAGDCGIASTAGDLAKFGRMVLNGGQGPAGPILTAASAALLSDQPRTTSYGFAYGYGFEVHRHEDVTYLGHGGGMPGYEAFVLLDTRYGLGVTLLSTRPSIDVRNLAWTVMRWWRQAHLSEPLDPLDLASPDLTHVENAADFAGSYHSAHHTLTFSAENGRLILHHAGDRIVLEKRGIDRFYVTHADFDRFLLQFGRAASDTDTPGAVIEAAYGPNWYASERNTGPRTFDDPPGWQAYPGHYRAHIPWQTNFRVILRQGALWLVWPSGDEEPLTPLHQDTFRSGDELSPERLQFSQMVNGQALCANYSGSDYYRFFVP